MDPFFWGLLLLAVFSFGAFFAFVVLCDKV
jgi:hypothetical protein